MMKPEIRFNGFNDEWVEKKLGNITNRFDGNRKAVAALNRVKGDTPYYGAVGIQGYVNGYTHDGDYLLIAEDGASSMLGYPVRVTSGKIWVNNHAHVLAAISDVTDDRYLKNKLMTIDMTPYITGGSRHKLTASDLSNIKIQLPTLPEQQKIGALFSKYDDIIALREQKLEELDVLKKGLLQQMFDDGHKLQVRFSGFNDDWVERKLGDVAEIAGGRTPLTSDTKYWDGGKDWYTPSDLTTIGRRTRGSARSVSQFASLRIWPENTVLLSTRAGIGKMTILTKEASINQGLKAIRLKKDFDPDFIYSYQPTISKQANRLASGSTFTEISTHDVNKIKLNFPTFSEQQKIGALFEKLDAEITAEQAKIDWLKEQKKGLLKRVV